MVEQYIVRWIVDGQRIVDGKAYSRAVGDEDIVNKLEMKSMTVCGQAVNIGLLGDLNAKRIVRKGIKL